MKKDRIKEVVVLAGIFLMTAALFLGLTMVSGNATGTNVTNDTLIAKVFVWNTEPNITKVIVSPSSIDLNAGNTTQVNCTAYVWDYNGWQDIRNISASFYRTIEGDGTTTDNNYRYINKSCGNASTSCTGISANNASCTCSFEVWYYAYNGSWQCNMTITDDAGNATERFYYFNDSEISGNATINTIVGIEAPSEIDYGNLSVTETSGFVAANITNWGNVPINISVRGWGGTGDYSSVYANLSMVCKYGNISIDYERYSINNSLSYANMTNLTSNFTLIPNFELPIRTNDSRYGNDTNTTYWKIQIPLTVGGNCNGTVQFSAADAS